jgi:hypothetical protein
MTSCGARLRKWFGELHRRRKISSGARSYDGRQSSYEPNMKGYFRKHKSLAIALAFGVFLFLNWAWSVSAPVRGRFVARIDVRRGHYQVLGYGVADRSRSEYARCLRERYKIEYRTVAGCLVSESFVSYVKAYHSVVTEAANRKFGHDVFLECAAEADQTWKAKERQQASQTER